MSHESYHSHNSDSRESGQIDSPSLILPEPQIILRTLCISHIFFLCQRLLTYFFAKLRYTYSYSATKIKRERQTICVRLLIILSFFNDNYIYFATSSMNLAKEALVTSLYSGLKLESVSRDLQ